MKNYPNDTELSDKECQKKTNGTIFYPLTPYHLMLSVAIRLDFNKKNNVIILDSKLFNKDLIFKIKFQDNWSSVVVIESESKLKRVRSLVSLYFTLFKNKKSKVVYFSPGNSICNFMVNKLALENEIRLGEDGLAPYQFKDFEQGYKAEIGILEKRNRPFPTRIFSQFAKLARIEIDWKPENIKEILLTNMALSQIKECKVGVRQIATFSENRVHVLDEVSKYYENLMPTIDAKYDVVFFHSEDIEKDSRSIDKLKKINEHLRIFHKMRVKRENNTLQTEKALSLIGDGDYDHSTPWEILYYKNQISFSNATLVANYLTTAFMDSFEQSEKILNRVIIPDNREEIASEKSIHRLFELIKIKCVAGPDLLQRSS